MTTEKPKTENVTPENAPETEANPAKKQKLPDEFGGFDGLEPTRYGDWEQNGRCSDF